MKKNKATKRILFAAIAVVGASLALFAPTAAHAIGKEATEEIYTADRDGLEDAALSRASESEQGHENEALSQDPADKTDDDGKEWDVSGANIGGESVGNYGDVNVFEQLYIAAGEHLSEIMCALTLAGSLILTLLYKKGLMPFLTRAIDAIGAALGGVKDTAERSGVELGAFGETLKSTEQAISRLSEHISGIERELALIKEDENGRERFKVVMGAQVELLYEIFMGSALPQYQKDRVGESIAEMRAALGARTEEE